jgi:uncharacterized protein YlzI (FlbEa/FlbD family)
MIQLTKSSGKFFVNPEHIAAFEEAGVSRRYRGFAANIRLNNDHRFFEVKESVEAIAEKIKEAMSDYSRRTES